MAPGQVDASTPQRSGCSGGVPETVGYLHLLGRLPVLGGPRVKVSDQATHSLHASTEAPPSQEPRYCLATPKRDAPYTTQQGDRPGF